MEDFFSSEEWKIKWSPFTQFIEGSGTVASLNDALIEIQPICTELGLPLSCCESLVYVLNKLSSVPDSSALSSDVINYLIPNKPLTVNELSPMVLWFCLSYPSDAAKKLSYWFLVAIRIGVIEKSTLRRSAYFSFFSTILKHGNDDNGLAYLIKELTLPKFITENRLSVLQDSYKKLRARKHIAVLLKHYIDNSNNISSGVIKLKKLVKPSRLVLSDEEFAVSLDTLIKVFTNGGSNISSKEIFNDLNKNAEWDLTQGSNGPCIGIAPFYGDSGKEFRLSSLNSEVDLFRFYDKVVPPRNMISVLGMKLGPAYVALSCAEWQSALEEQIKAILMALLNNEPHPLVKYPAFLTALVEVQKATGQGIPSVTQFLSNYFIIWDKQCFLDQISELIPWAHFNSYEELKEFMTNLFEVYVISKMEFKYKILTAFGRLYTIQVRIITVRAGRWTRIPFIIKPPSWMIEEPLIMLDCFLNFFSKFVETGMVMHRSNPAFLIQSLLLYHQIFKVQKTFNLLSKMTILPPSLCCACQTSSNIAVLNTFCMLLNSYWEKQDEILNNSTDNINKSYNIEKFNLIRNYAFDITQIILKGLGESMEHIRLAGFISENERETFKNSYGEQDDAILSLTKNFATSEMILEIAKKHKINLEKIKPRQYPDLLGMIARDCSILINKVLNSDNETESAAVSPSSGLL